MANRLVNRRSTLLIIREMEIKTTVGCHLTPVRMAVIKKSNLIDSIMKQNMICIFFSAFTSFEICFMAQNMVGLISHTSAR